MATFVNVTRRDSGTQQLINLDAVEMIDVHAAEPLPPLDSPLPITAAHLGSLTLHFISSHPNLEVLETEEDWPQVVKGGDTKPLAEARAKKLAKIVADRAKARADAARDLLEQEREATLAATKTEADDEAEEKVESKHKARYR